MKLKISIIAALAISSALLLTGCQKSLEDKVDATLNFSTDVLGIAESKAAVVTDVTDFYTMGFDGTTQWFPKSGSPQNVVLSGGAATFDSYKWVSGKIKTFYAYSNNLPSGVTASIASTGVTLNVTSLPADASAQKDILLGVYKGDGSVNGSNSGTATLHFYHPMAALQFSVGTIAALSEVTSIEVKGLYSKGSAVLNTETAMTGTGTQQIAQFAWTGCGGSLTAKQACNLTTLTAGTEIGSPFMLIPQTFTGNVKLTISVKMKDGMPRKIVSTLNTGSLVAGKKTVCAISYDGRDVSLSCTIADWGTGQSSTMKVEE